MHYGRYGQPMNAGHLRDRRNFTGPGRLTGMPSSFGVVLYHRVAWSADRRASTLFQPLGTAPGRPLPLGIHVRLISTATPSEKSLGRS